jgi:hypothetical protein
VGYEPTGMGGQYVLRVSPKSRSKYVYRGKVWVDGTDFAVRRIEAEPAQNPSFWPALTLWLSVPRANHWAIPKLLIPIRPSLT